MFKDRKLRKDHPYGTGKCADCGAKYGYGSKGYKARYCPACRGKYVGRPPGAVQRCPTCRGSGSIRMEKR